MRLSLAETQSTGREATGDHQAVPDTELVMAVANGSEEALGALFRRHAGVIMALGRRMLGSREDAEEVLHDTFLRLWSHAADFDPQRAAVRTYLYAVARNLCVSRLRAKAARPAIAALDPESSALITAFSQTFDLLPLLLARRALEALDERDRVLMEEAYFGGWSQSELAQRHALPLGTLKSRMRRSLIKMRAAVESPAMDGDL